jgi:hypothetical protein
VPLLDWKQRAEFVRKLESRSKDLRSFKPTLNDEMVRLDDDDGLSFFELRRQLGGFRGESKVGDSEVSTLGGSLELLLNLLGVWLAGLEDFHNTPDAWTEVEKELGIGQLGEGQENTAFGDDEIKQVEAVAAQVLTQVEQLGLPEPEVQEIKSVLDYAVDGARWARGRVDWTNMVAGYLFNKVADGTVSPETMRKVGHLLAVGFGALFGHPLTGIGPGGL